MCSNKIHLKNNLKTDYFLIKTLTSIILGIIHEYCRSTIHFGENNY